MSGKVLPFQTAEQVELFKSKMFHQQFKFMDKGLHLPVLLFGGAASTTADLVIDDDLAIISKFEKIGHKM